MSLSGELPVSQSCELATPRSSEGATPPVRDTLTPLEQVAKQRTKLRCYCKSYNLDITPEVINLSEPLAGGGFADIRKGDRLPPERRQLWPWLVNIVMANLGVCSQSPEPEEVAVKILRVDPIKATQEPESLAKDLRRLRQEIGVWRRLEHPNVQKLIGVLWYEEKHIPAQPVSRWEKKGNLTTYLSKSKLPTISAKVTMLQDILDGLTYLHEKNVIHADLKGENVLISSEGKPLLCDFGIAWTSVKISVSFTTRRNGQGTCQYMAPELLDEDFPGDRRYTPASDIWAFGCLATLVLANAALYVKTSTAAFIAALLRKDAFRRPDKMENSHWALVLACCSFSIDLREDSNFLREHLRVLQLLEKKREDLPEQARVFCNDYLSTLEKYIDAAENEFKSVPTVPSTGQAGAIPNRQAEEQLKRARRERLADLAGKHYPIIVKNTKQATTRLTERLEEHSLRHLL